MEGTARNESEFRIQNDLVMQTCNARSSERLSVAAYQGSSSDSRRSSLRRQCSSFRRFQDYTSASMSRRQSPRKLNRLMSQGSVKKKRRISGAATGALSLAAAAARVPASCSSFTSSPHFVVTPAKSTKLGTAASSSTPSTPRTGSFDAMWAGNFESLRDKNIKVHTLILGTHPSIASLAEDQYYAHPLK